MILAGGIKTEAKSSDKSNESFTNVVLFAHFAGAEEGKSHKIIREQTLNGLFTTSSEEAKAGEVITVNAKPATGYEVEAITINGNAISGNTFTMPA